MATYSIIGAGSSSGNPVTVFAGCEETVNVCWTGRMEVDGYCSECTYHDDQYCSSVSGVTESTTGTIPWSGGTSVHYEIIKNCVPEPVPQPCSSYTCSDFSLYTVPSYIDLVNPPTNIDIHYSYLVTYKDDDGHICGREELSNVDSIDFDDFKPSGDTKYVYSFAPLSDACSATSGVATVYVLSDEDTCDSGVTVDVTTSFSPSVVPALPSSGTDVTINVMCRKVEVSKDCTKKITNTGNTLVWHVKCCTDCSENSGCCTDHTVSSAFTMEYIRDLAGVDEDAVIRYNGVKATSEIPFSIVQKGKDTEECSASTEDKVTKYCVSSCTGDVEYEDSYMSNTWFGACVPFGGGRIKVSWDYSAFTYSCVGSDCTLISHSDSAMTWEEIIDIPACDEMDSTCDYTERGDDGKISGTCELYFKEQALPADCTTCEGEVPPGETEKFNVITYTFVQDCKSECTPYTNTIYGKINPETGEIEKVSAYTSDYVEDSKCYNEDLEITVNDIPYTSVTEYVGSLCPERRVTAGTTSTTVTVKMIPNNSPSARTIFENDMICVVQEAGPCDDDTLCGAEVTLISGLARGDYALVEFYTVEPESLQATYSIKSGETATYYSKDEAVIVGLDSEPDNSNDYIYKYYGSTEEIPSRVTLGCGEGISSAISAVAESYCACKSLKKISGETAITADGGDSITVAVYTATCEDLDVGIKYSSGDEILILNDPDNLPVFSNGVITAKVSANESTTNKRTGNYILFNKVTETDCPKNKFTVKQEKKVLPECNIEWLGGEECITCVCSENDFRLNATSISIPTEGYDDVIGTVGDCIDKVTMELVDNTWDDVRIQYADENNNIYLIVPGSSDARRETVKIAYSATCGGDVWEKSLTLSQEGSTCACSDLSFNGIDYDNPVIVTIYNSYSNVMYAFDVGLKVNDTWKNDQIGQEEGEIDYGKENVVTVFDYRDSDIGKTITNASATIGQTPQDQGMKYCRMECTPTTITSGAVIRLTWDGDWSGRYHSCDDSTPIPSSFDYKLSIVKPSAKTTPVVQFYTSNGTYAGGYGRVNADTVVNSTWSSEGTITKMVFAENYGDISRVTVKDNNGNNLINNQPLNGTITTLYLINNINTSDYTGGTKTIYVSFS